MRADDDDRALLVALPCASGAGVVVEGRRDVVAVGVADEGDKSAVDRDDDVVVGRADADGTKEAAVADNGTSPPPLVVAGASAVVGAARADDVGLGRGE